MRRWKFTYYKAIPHANLSSTDGNCWLTTDTLIIFIGSYNYISIDKVYIRSRGSAGLLRRHPDGCVLKHSLCSNALGEYNYHCHRLHQLHRPDGYVMRGWIRWIMSNFILRHVTCVFLNGVTRVHFNSPMNWLWANTGGQLAMVRMAILGSPLWADGMHFYLTECFVTGPTPSNWVPLTDCLTIGQTTQAYIS